MNEAIEVSTMVWFDDELDSWVYSIMTMHGDEETLIAWGEAGSGSDAATAALRELQTYISGL